jgi:hypothetical protein
VELKAGEPDVAASGKVRLGKHWTFDVIPLFRHYFSGNSSLNLRSFPTNQALRGSSPPCPLGGVGLQTSTALCRRDSGWSFSAPRDDTARASCGNGAKRKLLSFFLHGVRLIVSHNHQGLRGAIKARFGSVPHQRCQFHLLQNAMDHVPKLALRPKVLEELRAILHAPNKQTAQIILRQMVETYSKNAPELAAWLESNIPEGFTVFDLPPEHRVKMRTSNMIERVNQELKRRTRVIRVFPNIASLLRLITARLCEISDSWESGKVYLNMNPKSQSLAA